ncbi:PREDICTED: uncharacterized protein LOC108764255, partial [Trachymyrmex cornetzi]|uniref:uncharacterized protein LOC108764255 n=1 Tax=Trachymyrmex cornetzi TaxID=471704 RepID=UPI00084F5FCF
PILLSIYTEADMISFENVDEESYEEVNYFLRVGGFTAKEAVNLSFKEAIQDHLTIEFTWFGREEGLHPLYNTRIIKAIYGMLLAVAIWLQAIAREALRSAKQRHRTSIRTLRDREHRTREARNYWDERNEQAEEQEGPIPNINST